jgi:putative membrane protein
MTGFFFRLVITALGLYAASEIVRGFEVTGWGSLVVAALLLGIINAIVRPLVFILTLPITIVTLGLFLLVVNGISVALVAWLMPGVTVSGLWAATLAAAIVSLTSWFASMFVGSSGKIERFRVETTGRVLR